MSRTALSIQGRRVAFSSLLLTTNQTIWCVYYILTSLCFQTYHYPVVFASLRVWLSVLPMAALAWWREGYVPPRRLLGHFALLGICTSSLAQLTMIYGLYYANPIIAGLTVPTVPALVSLVSIATRREKFSWMKGGGILSTILGCLLLIFLRPVFRDSSGSNNADGRNVLLGSVLMFITIVLNVCGIFIQKTVSDAKVPVFTLNATYFAFGAVFMCVFLGLDLVLIEPQTHFSAAVDDMTGLVWGTLVYSILGGSTLGYILFSIGLQQSSPLFVTAFQPLQPLLSAIGTWMVFGLAPLVSDYIGAFFIILGLVLVLKAKAREQPRKDPRDVAMKADTLDDMRRSGGAVGAAAATTTTAAVASISATSTEDHFEMRSFVPLEDEDEDDLDLT